ncbi:MAG: hypothetical protein JWQ90_2498 [Hydrocarboniphaga sp.]|uniref:TonB-dependent receptor n=1 Tax=Hydrocarboniphaga sp. TaxID=2033016 RepID=UPI002622509F|nr:TonB-dependent receptor [Hydrocarboniphaga sp.]MDB5970048.1 hypothetical protein [Hydrocarboniphaga sp.]
MLRHVALASFAALGVVGPAYGQESGGDLGVQPGAPEQAPAAVASDPPAPAPAVSAAPADVPVAGAEPAAVGVSPAEPQQAEAPEAAPASSGNRMIEEVVVTAQKREENLQAVPISIQAFGAAQLDAKGIEEPSKLALVTPGLQYNTLVGYTFIYIRGVGSDTFIPSADSSVATYIDGIYYPFGFGLASSLGSVERVEVLKGPQGTLFGRNSSGGAISIITKQPDPGGVLETSITASRESYDSTHLRAFTNIPVSESFAVSLSGLYYHEDSFYKENDDPAHAGPMAPEISQGYSAKAGWEPIEDLKGIFGYTYLNTQGSYGALLPAGDPTPLGTALGVRASPDYVNGDNTGEYINIHSRVFNTDLKYHWDYFDTRFLGAVQEIEPAKVRVDYDGSKQPLVSFETTGQFAHVKTAELQFISNESAPDWLQLVGGIYYIKSSAGYNSIEFNVGNGVLDYLADPLNGLTSPVVDLLENFPNLADPGNPLNILDLINGNPNDNGVATVVLNGILDTQSIAGYFQGTAELTDKIALTLGGRYQEETRDLVASKVLVRNPLNRDQLIPGLSFAPQSAKTSNFSPKAVLDYKFSDEQHVYGSFSQGFKSGTFNIIAITFPPSYVPPEKVTAYELGYKATLLDGALRFNTAVFQNNIDDLQVGIVSLTSGGVTDFETAGKAKITGADFDATWQVLPDSLPGLVLTAGGAYLHGRYTDYPNGSGFDDTTGLFYGGTGFIVGGGVTPGRDFTGNKTVRTPTLSGNISPSYAFDLGNGQLEFTVDAYYSSGFYFAASNSEKTKQDSYTILNGHIAYYYEPWKTRITLFGNNLTDQKYYQTIQQFDFDTSKKLSAPVTYGLRLQWDL